MTDHAGPLPSPEDDLRIYADTFRDAARQVTGDVAGDLPHGAAPDGAPEGAQDVARDDALVESLARRRPVPGQIDEVTALLTEWCAYTDRGEDRVGGSLIGPESVGAARPGRRIAVATAMVGVVLFAGMVGVQRAEPGGPLWPLVSLVDHDRAASVSAAGQARRALDHAEESLAHQRLDTAERELTRARAVLPDVRTRDGRAEMAARLDTLQVRLDATRGQARPGSAAAAQPTEPSPSRSRRTDRSIDRSADGSSDANEAHTGHDAAGGSDHADDDDQTVAHQNNGNHSGGSQQNPAASSGTGAEHPNPPRNQLRHVKEPR
ncbi:MAG TPA: hypothetical protein VIS06_06705 [Mycobacteriales bacterium]